MAQPISTTIEGLDIEVEGSAFVIEFFDKKTGARLGTVKDIVVASEIFGDGSMKSENYTVLTFEEDNSTLVMHNFIDMFPGKGTELNTFIPLEHTASNVIGGTGRFKDVKEVQL